MVQMDVNKDREPQPSRLTIDTVAAQAKEVLLRDGYHQPILIVEGTDQALAVDLSEMADTAEMRQLQVFMAGAAVAQENLIRSLSQVFYIGEGWMSQQTDEIPKLPPSEAPDRVEVLMIAGTQAQTDQGQIILLKMLRNEQHVLVGTEEIARSFDAQSPLLQAFMEGFQTGFPHSNAK